ncbi:MAG TPA: hypothetical protein VE263_09110 [Candidatus Angelobacter sp.]|nr:hypothetical protein [Candidatus Angelobacter sp.]
MAWADSAPDATAGPLLFCYVLQSTVVTLWQGGVTLRDTFYPLEELKRGEV